ncbi:MAG: GDYXXLXY domain-containing protein, partial [Verrucomicrobia bacterium]|nr:GDYXXLXY domain-containing protein [Verrucomicrobiota bacterium]
FLRYAISALPETLANPGNDRGEMVYVLLQSTGAVWEIGEVSQVRPAGDVPYLKGRAYGGYIDYGIERYYVPEGKGKHVPTDLRAEIVIQPGGTAQLKRLYSAGQPWPK